MDRIEPHSMEDAMKHPKFWSNETYNIIKDQITQETDILNLMDKKNELVVNGTMSYDDVTSAFHASIEQYNEEIIGIGDLFESGNLEEDDQEYFQKYIDYV